jgi:internalin A
MKLQELNCGGTAVADLAPLAGMPLERLYLGGAGELRDLTALRGMKLEHLYCYQTQVEYLSVVAGMPLKQLFCYETPIHDLTPLAGMSLEQLLFSPAKITAGIGAVRQMTSLTRLGTNYPENLSPTDFWAKYDAGAFGKPR